MDNVNAIVKEHRRKATAIAKALNRYMENPKFRAAIEKHRKARTVRGNSTPVFGSEKHVYVFDGFEESLMRLADEQPELFEETAAIITELPTAAKSEGFDAVAWERRIGCAIATLSASTSLSCMDDSTRICIIALIAFLGYMEESLLRRKSKQ